MGGLAGLDSALITRSAVLYIFRADDTYTVSLETPTGSPSVLAGTVSVPTGDRLDVLAALERVVGSGPSPEPFKPDAVASAGRLMYSLFLPRTVQSFLRTWDGPLTISTNDPAIPWELLHDGQAFLGIKHAVGRRLISGRTPPRRAVMRRKRPTFLFIADPRGDLEGAAAEAQHLVATLSRRGFPCDLLLAERASYLNVQEALGAGRYDVIHYAGHARFGEDDAEESALELAQDRLLPASQIERVLRGAPLLFLNACLSGRAGVQDTAPAPQTYLGAAAESLASAFIFGGARAFIGALWSVHDVGSRAFAATLYDRVLAGDPVGEALRATRRHLLQERPAEATWASFVLYGDPTYRLWEGPAAEQPRQTIAVAASGVRASERRPVHSAGVARPVADHGKEVAEKKGDRLGSVVGALAILVATSLLILFVWMYERVSREVTSPEDPTVPAGLLVTATDTATLSVATSIRPTATNTPLPPTPTPVEQPTSYPPPQPTATALVIAPMFEGRLAFVSKPLSGQSTLYVMNADGSGLREIGPGTDPDWAPAGDKIAFAGLLEGESGIHLIDPDGTELTRLTNASDWQPTWSPDGRRIAFMSLRDGDREIYMMNADGGGVLRVSNNPWDDKHPSWSPVGGQIAFISDRSGRWQVWKMNVDGSQQVRLTHNNYDNFHPVWSPDGTQIAYGVWTGVRNEIWVMAADGGNEHMVTANAVYRQEFEGYGLAWEPQPFISFVSNRTGQLQIYAMNPDGSRQTAVTDMPAGAFSP
ncbi:MAG: CHAT domain-containing protein, partial [Anaerolineae bacterium]